MLSIGIVGLPNVGKSTLFNALTKSKQADAQNYPFCTIEPNVGIVEVPDERLQQLSTTSKSGKIIPTAIEFVDIAGLVKGASEGEGLGNKFLSHIREVDAIAHVVRSFSNDNITHVEDRVDPMEDAAIINLELILADWQTVSKRLENGKKKTKSGADKEAALEVSVLQRLDAQLQAGKPARELSFTDDEALIVRDLHLLSMKPIMYVVNTTNLAETLPTIEAGVVHVGVSAKQEAELSELSDEEAKEFLAELGATESGLDRIIKAGYELLNLVTFFTSGEQETRAWTVKRETSAQYAAGEIHTDFIKGFVKADIVPWEAFVEHGGWSGAKEKGKVQLVGKEHIVKDGDVCYFHIA